MKDNHVREFRESLFVYCEISLNIFKLPSQTQAAFWFMLFNWVECNNYSITIGPEKRRILTKYYSRPDDPNSSSVQNIFLRLTKIVLFVKCSKGDLICKNNGTYEVTYRVSFIISQQKMDKNFIKLNEEIIECRAYLKSKETNIKVESVEGAINAVSFDFR